MNMKEWHRHEAKAADRAESGIAKLVAGFRSLATEEARAKLHGRKPSPTPWERAALLRVLRERGETA